jgi:hypothetical protein
VRQTAQPSCDQETRARSADNPTPCRFDRLSQDDRAHRFRVTCSRASARRRAGNTERRRRRRPAHMLAECGVGYLGAERGHDTHALWCLTLPRGLPPRTRRDGHPGHGSARSPPAQHLLIRTAHVCIQSMAYVVSCTAAAMNPPLQSFIRPPDKETCSQAAQHKT